MTTASGGRALRLQPQLPRGKQTLVSTSSPSMSNRTASIGRGKSIGVTAPVKKRNHSSTHSKRDGREGVSKWTIFTQRGTYAAEVGERAAFLRCW